MIAIGLISDPRSSIEFIAKVADTQFKPIDGKNSLHATTFCPPEQVELLSTI